MTRCDIEEVLQCTYDPHAVCSTRLFPHNGSTSFQVLHFPGILEVQSRGRGARQKVCQAWLAKPPGQKNVLQEAESTLRGVKQALLPPRADSQWHPSVELVPRQEVHSEAAPFAPHCREHKHGGSCTSSPRLESYAASPALLKPTSVLGQCQPRYSHQGPRESHTSSPRLRKSSCLHWG